MPVSLEDCLVVGISSRALFDLHKENEIFEQEGLQAYSEYQIAHEDELLEPGSGFSLVKALLRLNELSGRHVVEVIIMSRNSAAYFAARVQLHRALWAEYHPRGAQRRGKSL